MRAKILVITPLGTFTGKSQTFTSRTELENAADFVRTRVKNFQLETKDNDILVFPEELLKTSVIQFKVEN